ncbi:MAG: hypothetical protein H6679_01195 [Epsilonproteobacteria bacterium]|nr:hypothetical protein [Campylobacterota bacterium]
MDVRKALFLLTLLCATSARISPMTEVLDVDPPSVRTLVDAFSASSFKSVIQPYQAIESTQRLHVTLLRAWLVNAHHSNENIDTIFEEIKNLLKTNNTILINTPTFRNKTPLVLCTVMLENLAIAFKNFVKTATRLYYAEDVQEADKLVEECLKLSTQGLQLLEVIKLIVAHQNFNPQEFRQAVVAAENTTIHEVSNLLASYLS